MINNLKGFTFDDELAVISAVRKQDIDTLISYHKKGIDFDKIKSYEGTLLEVAIKNNCLKSLDTLLDLGVNVHQTNYYGETALHEAAFLNAPICIQKLIEHGANINFCTKDGYTPFSYALNNNSFKAVETFLKYPDLDVNLIGKSLILPIEYAFFENNISMVNKIINHTSFDPTFTQIFCASFNNASLKDFLDKNNVFGDRLIVTAYNDAKLFGLKFDLGGSIPISVNLHNQDSFSFDGYWTDLGTKNISNSFNTFCTDVISESNIPSWAKQAFATVQDCFNFSAINTDPKAYYDKYKQGELVFIPSGWDEHSIGIIIHKDKLYRCNRGDESDGIHGVEEFLIPNTNFITTYTIEKMLDGTGSSWYMQDFIPYLLDLQKIGMIENPTQTVGNCVWTSFETSVEAALLDTFIYLGIDNYNAHKYAKNSFSLWENFDLTYTLNQTIENKDMFLYADIYDDLLIGSLVAHHDNSNIYEVQRGAAILNELDVNTVFERFDEEIGQLVYHYSPGSYSYINAMSSYDTPTFNDYLASWFYSGLTMEEGTLAREYIKFFTACDQLQKNNPTSVISLEDVLETSFINGIEKIFGKSASIIPSEHLIPAANILPEIPAIHAELI